MVLYYILIRKPKFHPYFENFSLKEIKKKNVKIINIGFPCYANVFEVGLFTGAIWLSGLWERRAYANQIALSLASDFYVCYGLECGCHDKSGKSERTYGLCEIAARGAIHIFISNTS
jgi:hypothetical protein